MFLVEKKHAVFLLKRNAEPFLFGPVFWFSNGATRYIFW